MTDNERDTYDRIVETAGARFLAYGFSSTTMDELASRLGMSKKTLYRFFESKRQIVRAFMQRELGSVAGHLDSVFEDDSAGFAERFRRLLQVLTTQVSKISNSFLYDLSRHAPDVWQEIEDFRQRRVFDRLEGLIADGIRDGDVRPDVSPKVVVTIIATVARHCVTPEGVMAMDVSITDVVATLRRMIYGGLLSEQGQMRLLTEEERA